MEARLASWSRPAEPPAAAVALVVGLLLLVASWTALHHAFLDDAQIADTPVYWKYGTRIANGDVPYRDFRVEYPPAALPVFAAPELGDGPVRYRTYRRRFEWLNLGVFGLALGAMAVALHALRARRERTVGALALAGVGPLLIGSVCLTRFDAWPAALCVGGIAAVVAGRSKLGLGALGVAVAAKLWPLVVAPFALVWIWRRGGSRRAGAAAAVFAGAIAAWYVPFLVLSPEGVWWSLSRQLTRPLQIESLGSSFLLVGHQLGVVEITMRSGHGSQNLVGTAPDVLAVIQTVLQAAVLVGLVVAFVRRRHPDAEDLVRFAAAGVVAFVALGKVVSPQFLIWLLPLVPLVAGRRGLIASALLAAICVLTQCWFPYRYWSLALDFDAPASWLVFARDLVLVGLLLVLVWPERSGLDDDGGLMRRPREA